MSIHMTVWAWDQRLPSEQKLLLLALVEHFPDFDVAVEFGVDRWLRVESMTDLLWGGGLDTALYALEEAGYVNQFGWSGDSSLMTLLDPSGRFEDDRAVRGDTDQFGKNGPLPFTRSEGYVYLLRGEGCYKIGRAKDPHKRSEQLAIQLPYEVELIGYWCCEDYKAAERRAHEHFADKRLNGEWFALDEDDLRTLGEVVLGVRQ